MSMKVAVINAFGRGDGLAVALAEKQFEVHNFDLTSQLGNWSLEDIQGPFGYLRAEPMDPMLVEHFHYSDPIHFLQRGLCFWGSKGPMEAKNPLFDKWVDELANKDIIGKTELRENFAKMWPLLFLSTWNSIYEWTWNENSFANKYKRWRFEFGFVHPTRQGIDRRLAWFADKGVNNHKSFQILDVATQGKNIQSIEIEGPERGLMSFDEVIWCLSLEQTQYLSVPLSKKLFGWQEVKPEFSWMRYRFELTEKEELQYLPRHMILLKDEFDHWTHSNLVIMQRTPMLGFWDIWCKIPTHQRFSNHYIDEMKTKISETLKTKLPETNVVSVIPPTEAQYDYGQLGPSPFSTFMHNVNVRTLWNNLHFHGPESRYSYGLNELHERNRHLIDRLQTRREEQQRKRKVQT